jgi:hypothetical protein
MALESFTERSPVSWLQPEKQQQQDTVRGDGERSRFILWYWLGGFVGSLAVWVVLWRVVVAVLR